jgi:glycosyltransferase involved in cell wall biosynthesis
LKKVLHLIVGLDIGGAESLLQDLLMHSKNRNIQYCVVSMTDIGIIGARLRSVGVNVYTLGMKRSKPSLAAFFHFIRIIRHEHPDVIQTWMYHADLLGLAAGVFFKNIKIIWGLHAAYLKTSEYPFLTHLTRWLCARFAFMANSIIFNSQFTYNNHFQLGYRSSGWKYIFNGFDVNKYQPNQSARSLIRAELNLSEDVFLIGFIARFDPMKDHKTFLEAASRIASLYAHVHFILAGAGVDANNSKLHDIINAGNLKSRIHLLGLRADVNIICASLDASVTSSFAESFSNSTAEAMSCGVPCIVTDTSNLPSLVGDAGIIVPVGQPKAMAKAMIKLIDMDPITLHDIGMMGRQRIINNYSLNAMIDKYEDLYLSL